MSKLEDILRLSGKKLSEEQLNAVNSKCATVVSAGAGSGKTTVLSFRFLKLVLDGIDADRILTITFTKKAAAEMYGRIHQWLSLAVKETGDSYLRKELDEKFPKASISTMDSFWSEIARSGVLRYGITRDFSIMSDDDSIALSNKIVDRLSQDESLINEYGFLSSNLAQDRIYRMFLDISKHITILSDYSADDLNTSLDELYSLINNENHCKEEISGVLKQIESYRELACKDKGIFYDGSFDKAMESLEGGKYDSMPIFGMRYSSVTKDWNHLKEIIKIYNAKLPDLVSSSILDKSFDKEKLMPRLIVAFANEFNAEKRKSGTLAFSDVEAIAKSILINDKSIRNYYKSRFDYIMVDEFQDNNKEQKDMLYLLSEDIDKFSEGVPRAEDLDKNKLFFVGDDKQSIYRFRGADVSIFNSLKDEVVNKMGGVFLSLGTNYRSEEKLVKHFNSVFGRIFKKEDKEKDKYDRIVEAFSTKEEGSYEASASDIVAGRKAAPGEPVIEIAVYPKGKQENESSLLSKEDAEAEWIASKVLSILDDDSFLIANGGKTRKPNLDDIGILYPTTKTQMPIEKALRRKGISYTVMESSSSTLEGLAYDLYSFLQLLVYPNDRKSYIEVLLSPFARISNEGLSFFINRNGEITAFEDDIEFTNQIDRESFLQVKELYQACLKEAGRERICSTLERLYYSSGYRTYLMSSKSLSVYDEHFSYIWTLANEFDEKGDGIVAFLDYIRDMIGKPEKLNGIDIQRLGSGGVKLMTIHKSKGLEFPIVILAGIGRIPNNQEVREPIVNTVHNGKPFLAYDILNREYAKSLGYSVDDKTFSSYPLAKPFNEYNKKRFEAEKKRQLYVALTRAINHLIITSTSDSGLLYSMYKEACPELAGIEIPKYTNDDIERVYSAKRDNGWYDRCTVAPSPVFHDVRIGVKEKSHEEYDESSSYIGDELPDFDIEDILIRDPHLRSEFGTLVHSELEALIKKGPFIEYRNRTLSDIDEQRLSASAIAIANRFSQSSFFKKYIDDKKELLAEVRFFYPDDNRVLEGSADLFALGDEYNLVVDYKTDKHRNPDMHKGQLTTYARALEELYNKKCYAVVFYVRDLSIGPVWDSDGGSIVL